MIQEIVNKIKLGINLFKTEKEINKLGSIVPTQHYFFRTELIFKSL